MFEIRIFLLHSSVFADSLVCKINTSSAYPTLTRTTQHDSGSFILRLVNEMNNIRTFSSIWSSLCEIVKTLICLTVKCVGLFRISCSSFRIFYITLTNRFIRICISTSKYMPKSFSSHSHTISVNTEAKECLRLNGKNLPKVFAILFFSYWRFIDNLQAKYCFWCSKSSNFSRYKMRYMSSV